MKLHVAVWQTSGQWDVSKSDVGNSPVFLQQRLEGIVLFLLPFSTFPVKMNTSWRKLGRSFWTRRWLLEWKSSIIKQKDRKSVSSSKHSVRGSPEPLDLFEVGEINFLFSSQLLGILLLCTMQPGPNILVILQLDLEVKYKHGLTGILLPLLENNKILEKTFPSNCSCSLFRIFFKKVTKTGKFFKLFVPSYSIFSEVLLYVY